MQNKKNQYYFQGFGRSASIFFDLQSVAIFQGVKQFILNILMKTAIIVPFFRLIQELTPCLSLAYT